MNDRKPREKTSKDRVATICRAQHGGPQALGPPRQGGKQGSPRARSTHHLHTGSAWTGSCRRRAPQRQSWCPGHSRCACTWLCCPSCPGAGETSVSMRDRGDTESTMWKTNGPTRCPLTGPPAWSGPLSTSKELGVPSRSLGPLHLQPFLVLCYKAELWTVFSMGIFPFYRSLWGWSLRLETPRPCWTALEGNATIHMVTSAQRLPKILSLWVTTTLGWDDPFTRVT